MMVAETAAVKMPRNKRRKRNGPVETNGVIPPVMQIAEGLQRGRLPYQTFIKIQSMTTVWIVNSQTWPIPRERS